MKKAPLKSVFFILLTTASIFSFLFLQTQRVEMNSITEIQKIEQVESDEEFAPTLPDAEILKEIVKTGKKYMTINLH